MSSHDWPAIIAKALETAKRDRNLPVLGAAFFHHVKRAAEEAGILYFPPDPEQSFKDFLHDHKKDVWVIPRKGKDFWALTPDGADLLAAEVSPAVIRRDLFAAFTQVSSSHTYWYDPKNDAVERQPTTADVVREGLVQIPQATIEEEKALRAEFARDRVAPQHADALSKALASPRPLSAFSRQIHTLDLSEAWHAYRLAKVLQQIRDWTVDNNTAWQASWIEHMGPTTDKPPVSEEVGWSSFTKQLESLDEMDIQRITVPLDVVLKLMKAASK